MPSQSFQNSQTLGQFFYPLYAPVKRNEQPNFWATIEAVRREKHLPRLDFLLGDFNLTEDALDRAPPKYDNRQATDAL